MRFIMGYCDGKINQPTVLTALIQHFPARV